MGDHSELTEAAREYAVAHAAHYSQRSLAVALRLYRDLISSRPNAPEAAYSRTQVQNILNAVVPAQELLEAQIGLALSRLEPREAN